MRDDSKLDRRKKIWIDLENSPHVPFFAPIIEELEKRGYSLLVTARDRLQVCELADLLHLTYKRVGHHYGKHRLLKIAGLGVRTLQLLPIILRESPDLALSHMSRSQVLLSAILRIPSLAIGDYECAGGVTFIHPTWCMAPEVIPNDALKRLKAPILKYPGIKEDVYVPRFRPDPSIRAHLRVNGDHVLVTLRPPAEEAHYHNADSTELFAAAIEFLSKAPHVKMVVLPRNEKQKVSIRKLWPDLCASGKIIIPQYVLDGLNLIWFSDLVISGGGTMNREAAALRVPVYSIFRGPIGAVDRYLAGNGRLVLLKSAADVRSKIVLARRQLPDKPDNLERPALQRIIDHIVTVMESGSAVQEANVQ